MKFVLAVMLPLLATASLNAAELPLAAKIDAVNGEVSARASSAASWVAAKNGTMLSPGGEVRTGKGASAVVVFSDNNKVRLNSATVFAIDGATTLKTELRLISGRFTAWVRRANKADFRVRHLAGVAAVRGTVLEGEGTDAGITFTLLQGAMDVTDAFGNTSSLNPGQSTNLTQAGGNQGVTTNTGDIKVPEEPAVEPPAAPTTTTTQTETATPPEEIAAEETTTPATTSPVQESANTTTTTESTTVSPSAPPP